MKIESTDQDIRNVLSSGYYRIPRFQRPYSWTRENIQDHVLKFGKPEMACKEMREEENLRSAFGLFTDLIRGVVQSTRSDTSLKEDHKKKRIQERLIAIRNAVLDLKVILVKLDDEDDAYIIFETLNTRGKDLSLTDLVKNHTTKHLKAKSASVDQPKIKWKKLLDTIEGSSAKLEVDTFIHHFWLSRYDYLAAKRLFKVLKQKI